MTTIAKILLIVVLGVGALSLAGCRRHRFRHGHGRNCPCCRIDVVDHDRHDSHFDVHVNRSRHYDRYDNNRRYRH
ncbi:MAG: hypothetical protein QGG42_15200 [Phycisphaerae bacterium]|nr:hypothetical protein [Phycisphaerae bacterium]